MLHQSDQLDLIYHALADAGRRAMLDQLSRGPATVSKLAEPLDMTLSAVVQHLKILEASGLVRSEKLGRVRTCRADPKMLAMAERWINQRRLMWERKLDKLGDLLASQPDDDDNGKDVKS
jgi:DNA-binding transcriptional ArsR family regulator